MPCPGYFWLIDIVFPLDTIEAEVPGSTAPMTMYNLVTFFGPTKTIHIYASTERT